jgi:hypothetical protein
MEYKLTQIRERVLPLKLSLYTMRHTPLTQINSLPEPVARVHITGFLILYSTEKVLLCTEKRV